MERLSEAPESSTSAEGTIIQPLQVGTRYFDDKRHFGDEISWGMDERYRLQPREMPTNDASANETLGTNGIRAVMHASLPSNASMSRWLPAGRRTQWMHRGLLPPAAGAAAALPARMTAADPADDLSGACPPLSSAAASLSQRNAAAKNGPSFPSLPFPCRLLQEGMSTRTWALRKTLPRRFPK